MPSRAPRPNHGPRMTRRTLLGLATLAPLAGCALDDPTVAAPGVAQVSRGSSSPSTDPALAAAATAERSAASWVGGVLSEGTGLPAAQRGILASVRNAHLAHASTLAGWGTPGGATPTTTTPSPSKVRGAWAALAPELAVREKALAAQHRSAALAATDGSTALLLCSLATFADQAAGMGIAPADLGVRPAEVDTGSRLEALQVLLAELRALAQGLQQGAGQLPTPSPLFDPARARLTAVWALRDGTETAIRQAGGSIPAPPMSYALPGSLSNTAAIQQTWGHLELQVLNAWGRLASASTGSQRAQALDQMTAQAHLVQVDGVPLPWWPGWA